MEGRLDGRPESPILVSQGSAATKFIARRQISRPPALPPGSPQPGMPACPPVPVADKLQPSFATQRRCHRLENAPGMSRPGRVPVSG